MKEEWIEGEILDIISCVYESRIADEDMPLLDDKLKYKLHLISKIIRMSNLKIGWNEFGEKRQCAPT